MEGDVVCGSFCQFYRFKVGCFVVVGKCYGFVLFCFLEVYFQYGCNVVVFGEDVVGLVGVVFFYYFDVIEIVDYIWVVQFGEMVKILYIVLLVGFCFRGYLCIDCSGDVECGGIYY